MTMIDGSFACEPNKAKAFFDGVYTEPDPREYYRVLGGLNYVIPDLAKDIFRQLIASLERLRGRPIKILDLGCSYGNNAALIRFPLDFARLQQRYVDLQNRDISASELVSLDRHFFQSWPSQKLTIVGCDISRPAVEYARSVGLIDESITQNLEQEPLLQASKDALRGVDLIISTGAIGYVTEHTLSRAASESPRPGWPPSCSACFPMTPSQACWTSTDISPRSFPASPSCSAVSSRSTSSEVSSPGLRNLASTAGTRRWKAFSTPSSFSRGRRKTAPRFQLKSWRP